MVNPLEADQLRQLLGSLQQAQRAAEDEDEDEDGDRGPSRPQGNRGRSQTASPPPTEDAESREALAYDKLILAGGWPVIPMKELRPISKMTKRSKEKAAVFVDLPTDPPKDYILPLFTSQLDHWNSFRQQWQWHKRGKAAGKEGFTEFLVSMKEEYLATGEEEMVADKASFEGMARRKWKFEQEGLEVSNGQGFKAYARAVETRLASHDFNFGQSFRLLEDPRQQDERTTLGEYLNFVYCQEDADTTAMENAEPQHRQAMEELLQLGDEQPAPVMKRGTLQQQLKATREELAKQWVRINKISQDLAPYLTYQARIRRHQHKTQWILEQLPLTERKDPGTNDSSIRDSRMKNVNKTATDNVANTRKLRKRKAGHEEDHKVDSIEPQPPLKRLRKRAQASTTRNSASVLASDGRLDRQNGSNGKVAVPAAPAAEAVIKPRRSQRQQDGRQGGCGKAVANEQPADMGGARVCRTHATYETHWHAECQR